MCFEWEHTKECSESKSELEINILPTLALWFHFYSAIINSLLGIHVKYLGKIELGGKYKWGLNENTFIFWDVTA
jgi:hypothetical protein